MKWLSPVVVLSVVLFSASFAHAGPYHARSLADTTRHDPVVVELLELPVNLQLPSLRVSALDELDAEQRIELRLGAIAPEALELRFDVHAATTIYLAADLDAELPRLDAMDGDTYFVVGVELRLTRQLRLFAEDFQPASMVVGDEEELLLEPPPLRSWDGHQVGVGIRWEPLARTRVEACAVFHVLSMTGRKSATGARLSVTFVF